MPTPLGRLIGAVSLLLLSPLIAALAIAVRVTSPGPAFHRARRVGPNGGFTLHKLRTMRVGAAAMGPGITAAGDTRVTSLSRFLRRTKLDELPQLWDVVRGEMALVGPRPEDARYVDRADPLHRAVFSALPGITGPTALAGSACRRIPRGRLASHPSDRVVTCPLSGMWVSTRARNSSGSTVSVPAVGPSDLSEREVTAFHQDAYRRSPSKPSGPGQAFHSRIIRYYRPAGQRSIARASRARAVFKASGRYHCDILARSREESP